MRNIQIVDGALNATYSIFQATDAEFKAIFSRRGQDMEIAEVACRRLGKAGDAIFNRIWTRPIAKKDVIGIHGTLFYDAQEKRKHFPKSMREKDWGDGAFNPAQRRMLGLDKPAKKSKRVP